MALVTIQRSPSPSNSQESELADGDVAEGGLSTSRHRRSRSALKRLRKFFHTVRFISKLRPCFSESYFAVKGAALVLPQSECGRRVTKSHGGVSGHGDIQVHLQSMFYLLRPQDTIKVAVKLESALPNRNRYLAVVSCNGKQDTEESIVLGIDCNAETTIGLVLAIWSFTQIKLDGDGGFLISNKGRHHIFKPVSVQVMWSALQCLYKVINLAVNQNYIPSGLTHTWIGYYNNKIASNHASIVEWHVMEDVETNRLETLRIAEDDKSQGALKVKIRNTLKEVMMAVDLDEATSKFLRTQLEERLSMDLAEFKSFIDQEMLTILGQMDAASKIFDYLYLGSEWNASNLVELREKRIGYILNITREIDNIFPETFNYMNIREYDVEGTNLLKHWERTHKFISEAKRKGTNVLVHCKMGVSRSASTVIAYAMKEYHWSLSQALNYVRSKRSCTNPNTGFMQQLETYQGILNASNQRHIFKSRSQHNLTEHTKEDEDDHYLNINQQCAAPIHLVHSWTPGESFHQSMMDDDYKDDYPEGQKSLRAPLFDNWQDFEISSRSADSTEDSWPDMPSPKKDDPVIQGFSENDVDRMPPPKIFTIGPEEDQLPEVTNSSLASSLKEEFLSSDDDNFCLEDTSMSKFKPDGSWIKMAAGDITLLNEDGQLQFIDSPEESEDQEVMQLMTPPILGISESETSVFSENDKSEENLLEGFDDENMDLEEETGSTQPDIGIKELYVKEDIPWFPGTVRKQTQDLEEKLKRNSLERGKVDFENSDTCSSSSEGNNDNGFQNDMHVESPAIDVSDILCHGTITKETSLKSIDISYHDNILALEEMIDASIHGIISEHASGEGPDVSSHDTSLEDEPASESIVALSDNVPSDERIGDKEPLSEADLQKNQEDDTVTSSDTSMRPTSVYDLEEIPFEPGSVRKSTQKIEERHRCVSSDHLNALDMEKEKSKPVQRSSSLKTSRVSPNSRDELDQRKSWTPIELPNLIRGERLSTDLLMDTKNDITDDAYHQSDSTTSQSPRQRSASVSTMEDMEDGRTVLVKCGREEIPLLPGLVKRQAQDFENLTSEVEFKIANPILHPDAEQSISTNLNILEIAPNNDSSTYTQPGDMQKADNGTTITPECESTGIDACKVQTQSGFEHVTLEQKNDVKNVTSDASTVDNLLPNVNVEQTYNTHIESQQQSVAIPSMFPHRYAKTSSNAPPFTKETLTLIREIGAALLNSPVKVEPDEGPENGPGAVRYLSRKFEKRSRKTKIQKSIVIVDKDKQERQRLKFGHPSMPFQDSTEQTIESKTSAASSRTNAESIERKSPTAIQPNSLCEQDTKKNVIRSDLGWGLNPVELRKSKCRTIDPPAQSVINDTSSSPPSHSALADTNMSSSPDDKKLLKGQMFGDHHKKEEPQSASVNKSDNPGTNLFSPVENFVRSEQEKTKKSGQLNLTKSSSRSFDLPKGLPSCVDRVFGNEPAESAKQETCTKDCVPKIARPKSAESSIPWRRQFASVQMHEENADVTQSRKIRKLHGKSHPLSKLEGRTTNSLYNTM